MVTRSDRDGAWPPAWSITILVFVNNHQNGLATHHDPIKKNDMTARPNAPHNGPYSLLCTSLSPEKSRHDLMKLAYEIFDGEAQVLAKLFGPLPATLKSDLTHEQAKNYQIKLHAIGIEALAIREETRDERPAPPTPLSSRFKRVRQLLTNLPKPLALGALAVVGLFVVVLLLFPANHTSEAIFKKYGDSVFQIEGAISSGTGFLIGNLLFTNHHVVRSEYLSELRASNPSHSLSPANLTLVASDSARDIAVFRVEPAIRAKTPKIRDRGAQARGAHVTIIGYPAVGESTVSRSVTTGVIGATHTLKDIEHYQLSAALNPGNSGGPIFDTKGNVVAIVSLKAKEQEGISFGVPGYALLELRKMARDTSADDVRRLASRHDANATAVRLVSLKVAYSRIYSALLSDKIRTPSDLALASAIFKIQDKTKLDSLLTEQRVRTAWSDELLEREFRTILLDIWDDHNTLKRAFESGSIRQIDRATANMDDTTAKLRRLSFYIE